MFAEEITGIHLRVNDPAFFRTARFIAILESTEGVVEIEYYKQSGAACGWGKRVGAILLTPGGRSVYAANGDVVERD